jgi:outer membrane immunogenic protein
MKSLPFASLILLGFAGHAVAADVVTEPPPPELPVVFDWTGFYAGVQAGGGWGDVDVAAGGVTTSYDISGAYGGGHLAARWQINQFTLGAEAEINYAGIDGDALLLGPAGASTGLETKINWFGSVNGELGVPFDRFLIYGTAGVAFGHIEQTVSATVPASFLSIEESDTSVGWTAGAGVDYAVTDNIVVGARYRYYDFGTSDFDGATNGIITILPQEVDTKLHTVSLKASYKF